MSHVSGPCPILCDLDGVVWLDHRPLPGAVDALRRLDEAGHSIVYVTNNSMSTRGDHERALGAIGVDAQGRVISSPMAATTLLDGSERVLVIGGAGIVEAVRSVGAEVVEITQDPADVDVVIVGLDRRFDYDRLERASTAVRMGARLIGTNEDATFPTPSGQVPGGGAILAAIAVASGCDPEIAGKPHAPMAESVARHLGLEMSELSQAVMIGDRPSTDGAFAQRLRCRFALVATGVTPTHQQSSIETWIAAADLAAVADAIIGP
jgi:HAD superfamily hydrolase (TIGR01450 family)